MMSDALCYSAVQARDARFDGSFFTAVTTTGIYCRPSCPSMTPKRTNVRFFPTAAAAHEAGFRACKRCRPDVTPGSPEWNARSDVVGRAMRLIADGVVEREGVGGLAARVGYGTRQLHRLLVAEVGAGALALARAQRTQVARTLLETTDLRVTDVALAAGFASVREFNETVRAVFALSPTQMRRRVRRPDAPGPAPAGPIRLRLPFRPPLDLDGLMAFLAARAVPGVEVVANGVYRRVLSLPHGRGTIALSAPRTPTRTPFVACEVALHDIRDLGTAVARCRRLLDLDADPAAVAEALTRDPIIAPLVRRAPGRRVPGHVDGDELAVRAVLGQQVSVAAARTLAGRLATRYGTPLPAPADGLTHAFPSATALAAADPADLPMPGARRRALFALTNALAEGRLCLDAGVDRDAAEAALKALSGIGPWTAMYVRMRALGDPDAFLPSDLGVRHGLEALGLPGDPAAAAALAERWRPWRAYALQHLWAQPAPAAARRPKPTLAPSRTA